MDKFTRTYHEKHKDDVEKLSIKRDTKQDKYNYKLEKQKIKRAK